MQEYPDLDDDFLKELSAQKSMPDKIHDRRLTLVGKAMGWLFEQFIFNAYRFSDNTIRTMTEKGQKLYDESNRRYTAIDRAIVRALTENDEARLAEAKKESGRYDPNWFCAEVSRMNNFCELHAATVERNCIQLNLPARSGISLAAYFYRPALAWGLFKSLFARP